MHYCCIVLFQNIQVQYVMKSRWRNCKRENMREQSVITQRAKYWNDEQEQYKLNICNKMKLYQTMKLNTFGNSLKRKNTTATSMKNSELL